MNIIHISSLLGVAAIVLQLAAFGESPRVRVTVSPPGSNIYLGECVLLQCTVEARFRKVECDSTVYQWYRSKQQTAPNPRHLDSGDSYFITAVTREDADRYWCQVKCWENTTVSVVKARPIALSVSELPTAPLSVIPNTRQMLTGEYFTVQCTACSSGWKLVHFSPNRTMGTRFLSVQFSPLGGGVSASKPEKYVFVAVRRNSGLYWCEGAEGRSRAVSITVSYGNIILKTPAFPVFTGDDVVLYCQYRTGNHNKTTFFKNGTEIDTYSSFSSDGVITMTIKNVTQQDEGLYKCASHDRKMESPESWLSVRPDRGNYTLKEEMPTGGSWKWIVVSCGAVLLFLIPLTIWLVCHYRYQMFCSRSCWPVSKQEVPAEALPATKQDVTEVQWDLSWMEMSNLLDKSIY
ncbi:uncharacterized protein LOC127143461 isoform X2 [Lates calcarifer]|uniref:Uncharacterized protein LOC127143461 isoform X2 n=1 Tax=Lates calcarifer TaxID=8187 RepID=A0AAJ8DW25_LATCA|nr:uncharacterized protein LOC127143461 isoform X2 [Lates calcarifer]